MTGSKRGRATPWLHGSRNHQWKGGRTIASTGYLLVKVPWNHHLADIRGYAYEHRVVAEKKLGRRLLPGEIVHHNDGNKLNNRPDNLEVVASIAHHRAEHRSPGSELRNHGQDNPNVECKCGCGGTFPMFDSSGRPRKFISGHNLRNKNG